MSVWAWRALLRRFDANYGKKTPSAKIKLMMWLIPTFILSILFAVLVQEIKTALLIFGVIAICLWLLVYAVLFPYKNAK